MKYFHIHGDSYIWQTAFISVVIKSPINAQKSTIYRLYFDYCQLIIRFELTTQDRTREFIYVAIYIHGLRLVPVPPCVFDNNSNRSNELGAAIGPQPWNTNSNLHFEGFTSIRATCEMALLGWWWFGEFTRVDRRLNQVRFGGHGIIVKSYVSL